MTTAESRSAEVGKRPNAAPYVPKLLCVVNLSPESMVEDSIARSPDEALARALELQSQGASIIDLGGRSITPDAPQIGDPEEQRRLEPAARRLRDKSIPFSIDTWSPDTACAAVDWGADVINFTGQHASAKMLEAIAGAKASLILTHMPYGNAYEMRTRPRIAAPSDAVGAILESLEPRVAEAHRAGIEDVIVDPNLGIIHPETDDFEKIHRQLEIVWQADRLRALGCPLLFYAARKPERLARIMMASSVVHARADYIRTHDPATLRALLRHTSGEIS